MATTCKQRYEEALEKLFEEHEENYAESIVKRAEAFSSNVANTPAVDRHPMGKMITGWIIYAALYLERFGCDGMSEDEPMGDAWAHIGLAMRHLLTVEKRTEFMGDLGPIDGETLDGVIADILAVVYPLDATEQLALWRRMEGHAVVRHRGDMTWKPRD